MDKMHPEKFEEIQKRLKQFKGVNSEEIKGFDSNDFKKLYDYDLERHLSKLPPFEEQIKMIVPYRFTWAMKHLVEGDSILDVGCQYGLMPHLLKEKGFKCAGVDVSEECVKETLKNVKEIEVKVCDESKLPWEDKAFDVIISTEVLEHQKDPEAFIKELFRVAKKRVLITTPIEDNMLDPTHLQFFDFYDIVDLFEKFTDDFEVFRINKFLEDGKKNLFAIKANVMGEMDER